MTTATTYIAQNIQHIKSRLDEAVASFADIKITNFSYNKFKDEIALFFKIRETTPRLYFYGRNYSSKESFQTDLNISLARLYYTRTVHPKEFKILDFSEHSIIADLNDKKTFFNNKDPDHSKRVYDLAKNILYVDRIQKALDAEPTRLPLQCPRVLL